MVGRTILHYKVVEKLGEGGMGVVYKAEDTQLRRTVALKFLSRETLDEEEVKARLIREAQAAAAQDHPNICHVYGIHEEDGETFIAMAYIDGPSLAEKIKERPLPLDEALAMAAQIAEGLHDAHEHGVVHRDVKPHNVMLTSKGQVKIMDFGLAALAGRSKLTKSGTTLGTPAYMAPEQLEGRNVDRRADVWALGCVLYEMLTQKTPFEADYEQAIGYGILNEDPEPVTAQRAGLSPEIDRLLSKALAKDRDERYQHADDLLADLRVLQKQSSGARKALSGQRSAMTSGAASPTETLPPGAVVVQQSSQRALQAAAVVLAVAFLGLLAFNLTEAPPEAPEKPVRRFSFAPDGYAEDTSVISPDGKSILFRTGTGAQGSLWLRSLENESARELAGTAGAINRGFWSPDSLSIGFATFSELKRVSINGGDPITLCELPGQNYPFLGGTWSPDSERIVFSSGVRLYEIPSRGGEPELLFDPGDSPRPQSVRPHFLPTHGGSHGLAYSAAVSAPDQVLAVMDLETGERRELGPGSAPFYSSDGYLIHGLMSGPGEGLRALPFSLDTLEATGQSFPIDETGRIASVSGDGTLVYTDRPAAGTRQIVWRSRTGELLEAVGQPQPTIGAPALSPDGQRVAVTSAESGNADIWVHDLTRSTKTRLTFEDQREVFPAWSPSGREIVYQYMGQPHRLMRRAADGTGEAVVLLEAEATLNRPDWSHDGRYLVYDEFEPAAGSRNDIRYIELGTDGEALARRSVSGL